MEIHKLTKEDVIRLYPHSKDSQPFIDYIVEKHSDPIGYSKFKGDKFKLFGNMEEFFDKNNTYPVYWDGEIEFVIGKDGKAYKLTPPVSWTKVKN